MQTHTDMYWLNWHLPGEYGWTICTLDSSSQFVPWKLPWLLWHRRLGAMNSIWPVKNWLMRCYHGYLSGARSKWFAYGQTDATTTPSSLASLKIEIGLAFLVPSYQVVLERRVSGLIPGRFICSGQTVTLHIFFNIIPSRQLKMEDHRNGQTGWVFFWYCLTWPLNRFWQHPTLSSSDIPSSSIVAAS